MIIAVDYNLKEVRLWACREGEKAPELCFFARDPAVLAGEDSLRGCIREISGRENIEGVSFRILFGGDYFAGPEIVNKRFLARFEKLTTLFPFYVPSMLKMLKRFKEALGGIPLVAFFETSFFLRLPESAKFYALPFKFRKDTSIRKWGFHGIFHQHNTGMFPPADKSISVVIDKQTTVCAASGNRPLSISLGYTPLEGVMSRTSCGDIDPGIVFYLMNVHNFSMHRIDEMLKNESGFLGLTGYDIELRDMLKLRGRDAKVDLAFEVYQSQVMKHIGEGIAAMGGLDNIVFAGAYLDMFIPVIYDMLKKVSFLGISTLGLPWKKDKGISAVSSRDSGIKVYLNRMELAGLIFYESRAFLKKIVFDRNG